MKRTPLKRRKPLKRTINALKVPMRDFGDGVLRTAPNNPLGRIKGNAPKRKPTKKTGMENEEYLDWLRTWPCFVTVRKTYPESTDTTLRLVSMADEIRQYGMDSYSQSSPTESAHVGPRGLGMRCPDREAMPLCTVYHEHATAGGGPESHHTLGKQFWEFHGIDRDEVLELLHRLYREETGREV